MSRLACVLCKAEIPDELAKGNRRFCSIECKKDYGSRTTAEQIYILRRNVSTKCVVCGQDLTDRQLRRHQICCSKECSDNRNRQIYSSQNPNSNIPTGSVGAISELVVCADLLNRGFSVYRSVSPNAPCDILALYPGKLLRVEVTTGYLTLGGKLSFDAHDPSNYDVIAVVTKKLEIAYFPQP